MKGPPGLQDCMCLSHGFDETSDFPGQWEVMNKINYEVILGGVSMAAEHLIEELKKYFPHQ